MKIKIDLALFPTQDECFKHAQSTNSKFFFSIDKTGSGKKQFGCSESLDEFLKVYSTIPDSNKNFYELIYSENPMCEYYDIDINVSDKTPEQVFLEFSSIRNDFVQYEMGLDDTPDWRITDSSRINDDGTKKISLHLLNRNYMFKNQTDIAFWYNKLSSFVNTHYSHMSSFIDFCVKSKNRQMRMIGSSKMGQVRPLEKAHFHEESRTADIKEFFIQNINYELLSEKIDKLNSVKDAIIKNELEYKATSKKQLVEQEKIAEQTYTGEEDEIHTLITLITNSIDDKEHSLCDKDIKDRVNYENFRNLCFSYVNAQKSRNEDVSNDELIEYIEEFIYPYYRHASNYESLPIIKSIVNSEREGAKYTIKSLYYWARENPDYLKYFSNKKYFGCGVFNPKEKYYFGDFKEEIETSVFDSYDDLKKFFISKFNKVVVVIKDDQDTFILKKQTDDGFEMKTADKEIKMVLRYLSKGDEKTVKFKELYSSCIDNIKRYDNAIFKPYAEGTNVDFNERFHNTFYGFNASKVDKVNEDDIAIILNHIKSEWCRNDETLYTYIISWFSHIIQKPDVKTGIMIVLYSEQEGIGKGIVCEKLVENLFGCNHAVKLASIEQVFSKFNTITKNKLFTVIDELNQGYDKSGDNKKINNKKKSILTDKLQSIEGKGENAVASKDYNNFIGLTNENNAVKIDATDRRHVIANCSDSKKGDSQYFSRLSDALDNMDIINQLYTYFLTYKITINIKTDLPITEQKQEMINYSAEQPLKYFRAIETGEFIPTYKNKTQASCDELYTDFNIWLLNENDKNNIYTKAKFSRYAVKKFGQSIISQIPIIEVDEKGKETKIWKTVRVYDVSAMLDKMREATKPKCEDES